MGCGPRGVPLNVSKVDDVVELAVAAEQRIGARTIFEVELATNRQHLIGGMEVGETAREGPADEPRAAGDQKSLHAPPTMSGVKIGGTLNVSDS